MKQANENGMDIEYTKSGLAVIRSKRLLDGTRMELNRTTHNSESERDYDYNSMQGDEVPIPWPAQTREEASRLGQSKYYSGKLCKHAHVSQRYVCSGRCVSCTSNKSKGFKINQNAARRGLVPLNLMVRPEHTQLIRDYIVILESQGVL